MSGHPDFPPPPWKKPFPNVRRGKPMIVQDGCALIPLDKGLHALVDIADFDWLNQYEWHEMNGYAKTSLGPKGKQVPWAMHRAILHVPQPGHVVDHINRNGLDNRRANLRPADLSGNGCNRVVGNRRTPGFRGVFATPFPGVWHVRIVSRGERHHIGSFRDQIAAARAYDIAARQYHGEFAVLNFPDRAAA